MGSAGAAHKHGLVRAQGVRRLLSSRDGAAFALGGGAAQGGRRLRLILNSLSLDFISASVALLGEGGAFEEIGKRGVWAAQRQAVSSSATAHCAIALDADMA